MTETRRNVLILLIALSACAGFIFVSKVVVHLPTEPKNTLAVNDEELVADLIDTVDIGERNGHVRSDDAKGVTDGNAYEQIKEGMTYDEVVNLLNRSGKKTPTAGFDAGTERYLWAVESGHIEITFRGGRVIRKRVLR